MRCIRVKAGLAPSGPWGFRLKKQGFNSGSSQRLRAGGGQAQGGVLSRRAMGFAGFGGAHGRGAMNSAALSL